MSERARDPVLARFQVEQFLYREARLMDGRSYDAWESLWTDDGVYWVPANGDDTDPLHDVSLLYDNRARLATRIARLKSDKAHSQDPPPRLVRLVSNVEIETFEPECRVHSTFLLVESRPDRRITWAARVVHHLRADDDRFRIAFKKVILVDNDQELTTLDVLL